MAFAFSIFPSPQIQQRPLRLAFPDGRPTGLPRSTQVTILGDLGPTYTPEVQRSRQGNRYALVLTSYHFGPGVSSVRGQYLAPVLRDDACGGSHMLAISPDPSPFTAWYWQLAPPLTFLVPTRMGVGILCPSGYIVSEASHPIGTSKSGFPNDARSGRVPMAKHQVTSQLLGSNSYLCDFVSQNKGVTCLRFGFGCRSIRAPDCILRAGPCCVTGHGSRGGAIRLTETLILEVRHSLPPGDSGRWSAKKVIWFHQPCHLVL